MLRRYCRRCVRPGVLRTSWADTSCPSLFQASILLNLSSLRFKQQAVVKANKFGQLNQNLRNLRAKAATVLKDVSAELGTIGAEESTSEQRRAFADGTCKSLQQFDEVRSMYSFTKIHISFAPLVRARLAHRCGQEAR